ncbi:MAG: CapA family protein [Paludibacteraceae bacterium]|nr:CapA family protein [Paludibacteraceae bacterium]MBN2786925.1 CapA family protein [Paludibacteraceae bacterium]
MKKTTIIIVFTVVFSILFGNTPYKFENKQIKPYEWVVIDSIELVFAGDIMGHMPQIKAAYNKDSDTFDFEPCYRFIKPYIQSADVAVANLEVPLAGKPYSGYPNFSSPDELFEAPISAGFDVMLLANNHAADKGKSGIEKTIKTVSAKSKFAGVYLDVFHRDSLYPLLLDVKGVKIALLNCTYDTNGNPVTPPQLVNLIDTAQIRKDVATAKTRKADFIIMCIHWGKEYMLSANAEQQMLAQYFASLDIDLIIGSHPHVVQNFDYVYKPDSTQVPVYYSLGNVISNQTKRNTNGGILAKVVIDTKSHTIKKCGYTPFYVYKGEIEGNYQYYLLPTADYLSNRLTITIPQAQDSLLRVFDTDTRQRLSNLPIVN